MPGGANVLFMDGHVQFIKYQTGQQPGDSEGDFPVTPLVSKFQGRKNGGSAGKMFDFTVL